MDARKYRGIIPPITTTSLRQAVFQRPEKPLGPFRKMMEGAYNIFTPLANLLDISEEAVRDDLTF